MLIVVFILKSINVHELIKLNKRWKSSRAIVPDNETGLKEPYI